MHKGGKIEELFKNLAADFLARESNRTSLITVTACHISDRLTKATIFITVFPEDKQDLALKFVRRQKAEFKEYVREHAKVRNIPYIEFEIDIGEKNRQLIDRLST